VVELHVVRLEQAEQRRRVLRRFQLPAVPDIGALRVALAPFADQVAAVQAQADLVVVFRIALLDRRITFVDPSGEDGSA
jgi:hypothetical protein